MDRKKVVYITGPIGASDVFDQAEEMLTDLGYTPLRLPRYPQDLAKESYMRICLAAIDSADAVLFLKDWQQSDGPSLERAYCLYIGKPSVELRVKDYDGPYPPAVTKAWLKNDLEEVIT